MNSCEIWLEIDVCEVVAAGHEFGEVGSYQRMKGKVHYQFDPTHSSNSKVVDIDRVGPVVECVADFFILCPSNLARGNGCVLYEVANRGDKRALQFFNDSPHSNDPRDLKDCGNGFLMQQGFTVVWSGWQGDLLRGDSRTTLDVPTLKRNAPSFVRAEFVVEESGIDNLPLSGNEYTRSAPVYDVGLSSATLTKRLNESDQPIQIPPASWGFVRRERHEDTDFDTKSSEHLLLYDGFQQGCIYELTYLSCQAPLLGMGFLAVRELISFLRYEVRDSKGGLNPLDPSLFHTYIAWGRSQSGRYLREFVFQGFNEDSCGREVFHGVWPHVSGGGRISLNSRFAQPGRYPRSHFEHKFPSDQFPFAYCWSRDPFTGGEDAILKRPQSDPFIFHTQTSADYWERRASLVHTDANGCTLDDHPKVRCYHFCGTQHFADPLGALSASSALVHQENMLNVTPLLRALLLAFYQWILKGKEPPPNDYPRLEDGSGVLPDEFTFSRIPAVRLLPRPNQLSPQLHATSDGSLLEPPVIQQEHKYVLVVPKVDIDGNEVSGLKTPEIAVPLGTFTGWNWLRFPDVTVPAGGIGSFFPFPLQKCENDHRQPLVQRWKSKDAYHAAFIKACDICGEKRLLLAEDRERILRRALAHLDEVWNDKYNF